MYVDSVFAGCSSQAGSARRGLWSIQGCFLYGLTASDVMPLEKFLPQTSWRFARKDRISMLGKAMSSLLKPLKRAAESGFEI